MRADCPKMNEETGVLHLFMHILGLTHESSRFDRMDYIGVSDAYLNSTEFYRFPFAKDDQFIEYDYNSVAKICDFGLVEERTGRRGYRQIRYCRRGSKYRDADALCKFLKLLIVLVFILVSGSPGFSNQRQLIGNYGGEENYFYFLFCDWKTSWSLLYRPIDEKEREIIDKITQVW